MTTLNRQRANILFSNFLSQVGDQMQDGVIEKSAAKPDEVERLKLLSPQEVAQVERIFETPAALRWNGGPVLGYAYIGASLSTILSCLQPPHTASGSYKASPSKDSVQLQDILEVFEHECAITWYHASSRTFYIVLERDTSDRPLHSNVFQLQAWMQTLICAKELHRRGISRTVSQQEVLEVLRRSLRFGLEIASRYRLWDEDGALESKGWDLTTGALEVSSGVKVNVRREGQKEL